MQKLKGVRLFELLKLYLIFYFNKYTFLVYFISSILMFIILFFFSNIPFSEYEYIINKENIINDYFYNAKLFLTIYNYAFISFLFTMEIANNTKKFDVMFFASIKKTNIYFSKILAYFLIIFLFIATEFIILVLIPICAYQDLIIDSSVMFYILVHFVELGVIFMFGFCVVQVFNNVMSALVIFAYSFALKLVFEYTNNLYIGILMPLFNKSSTLNDSFILGDFYYIFILILLVILNSVIYNKIDMKNK